jgi:hypothetical protein
LESEDVEEKVDVTLKVFVSFDFTLAESFFSGEISLLPLATTVMVAAGAGIRPVGGASTSSWRRARGAISAAAAKTSAGIAMSSGGRG